MKKAPGEPARNGFDEADAGHTMALEWIEPIHLILAAVVLFFFFIYLMIRRTLVSFREGVERGRNR